MEFWIVPILMITVVPIVLTPIILAIISLYYRCKYGPKVDDDCESQEEEV